MTLLNSKKPKQGDKKMNTIIKILNGFSGIGHWLPRASLAATFLYHGFPKFMMAQGMADMMGMPVIAVYMLAMMEVGGAVLLLWGGFGPDWATRIGGLLMAAPMVGAIGMVHAQNGWNSVNMGPDMPGKGMEFQVLILAIALFFAVKGNSANDIN